MVAFAKIEPITRTIQLDDDARKAGERIVRIKRRNPKLKVMLSIGGWENASDGFVDVVRTQATRDAFNFHVANWLRNNDYDGLDINWEYPGAKERGSSPEDKERFSIWVKDLQSMFLAEAEGRRMKKLILSAAVPASSYWVSKGYDVPKICPFLDFVNLMAYDLHGTWVKPMRTGHHAGLTVGGGVQFSVEQAVNMWIHQ